MNNATRFWILEARYQKAKRKAEKLIRRSNLCTDKAGKHLAVMQTAYEEQKKIMREMEADEILGDP